MKLRNILLAITNNFMLNSFTSKKLTPKLNMQTTLPPEIQNEVYKVPKPTQYAGSFCTLDNKGEKQNEWHSCRETYAGKFTRQASFMLFSHKPNARDNIQAFFSKVENVLNLKKNRTLVVKTDKPNISKIVVSNWWRKYLVRRQLFTILLRSAQNYKIADDNFEAALYSDKYASETKAAVAHFMKGNTFARRTSLSGGWRDSFSRLGAKDLVKCLIRPPAKPVVEVSAVDLEDED